jgi:hypothetical protein
MYGSLLAKIDSKKATFKFDMERAEWSNLWTVLRMVEDFMFYQPAEIVASRVTEVTEAQSNSKGRFLITCRPDWQGGRARAGGGSMRSKKDFGATGGAEALAGGELGIHLDPLKAMCEDKGLASR